MCSKLSAYLTGTVVLPLGWAYNSPLQAATTETWNKNAATAPNPQDDNGTWYVTRLNDAFSVM